MEDAARAVCIFISFFSTFVSYMHYLILLRGYRLRNLMMRGTGEVGSEYGC
jgi:hypothetical protein